MTGYLPIIIYFGPNYAQYLNVNDGINFRSNTAGTLDMPEMETVMADSVYSTPFVVRNKKKERLFSIIVEPIREPYTTSWFALINQLYDILHENDESNGSNIRVSFPRLPTVYHYLDCRLNEVIQTNKTQFEMRFTAADPLFKELNLGENMLDVGVPAMAEADTSYDFTTPYNPADAVYAVPPSEADDAPAPPGPPPILYYGDAPTQPVITFQLNINGGVYRYHKDFYVTNNSPEPLTYYPICLNLGDLRTLVSGGKMHQIGSNPDGIDVHKIKDIRIETAGGARKTIYIRDRFEYDGSGAWNQDVRIWFTMYSLAPGETKFFKLIYGNVNSPYKEVYPEDSTAKCMFNMYLSDNGQWQYFDFMPQWNQQQTRIKQWTQYAPNKVNLQPIITNTPAFNAPQPNLVPAAGGQGMAYAGTSGYAGAQLSVPVGISSMTGDFRVANNGKLPFVLRIQHRDGRWDDFYQYPTQSMIDAGTYNTSIRGTNYINESAGSNSVEMSQTYDSAGAIVVNDWLVILNDDGTYQRTQVTSVSVSFGVITFGISPVLTAHVNAGNYIYQHRHITGASWGFVAGDEPQTIVFAVRGDRPDLVTGGWYFGGMESVTITFASAEVPTIVLGTEIDIQASTRYQLRGRFGNTATGEYLRINTITTDYGDKVIVDCVNRTCMYYHWNGTTFDAPVNRLEALSFGTIKPQWIHLKPVTNQINFYADTDSNFNGADINISYKTLHNW